MHVKYWNYDIHLYRKRGQRTHLLPCLKEPFVFKGIGTEPKIKGHSMIKALSLSHINTVRFDSFVEYHT